MSTAMSSLKPEAAAAPIRNEPMPPAPITASDWPGVAPLRRSAVQRHGERLRHGRGVVGARLRHDPAERGGRADVLREPAVAVQSERVVASAQVGAPAQAPFAFAAGHTGAADDAVAEARPRGVGAARDHAAGELVAHDRRPLMPAERVRRRDREELRGVRELGRVGPADRRARDLEDDVRAGGVAWLGHVLDPHVSGRVVDGGDHRPDCSLKTHTAPKSTS